MKPAMGLLRQIRGYVRYDLSSATMAKRWSSTIERVVLSGIFWFCCKERRLGEIALKCNLSSFRSLTSGHFGPKLTRNEKD